MKLNLSQQLERQIRQIARDEFNLLIYNRSGKIKDLYQQHSPVNYYKVNIKRMGWRLSFEKFEIFWKLLIKFGLIDCKYEVFREHFFGTGVISDKIVWYGTDNRITFFINDLMDKEIIPVHDKPFVLICNHFRSIDKEFDPEKLRKNNSKGVAESKFDQFNQLLKEIKVQLALP